MQGFYISGDKLVTVGRDELDSATWALYYETVEVQGGYAARVSQFAVDNCNAAYTDEFYTAGSMPFSYHVYFAEEYSHVIDYIVAKHDACNGMIESTSGGY